MRTPETDPVAEIHFEGKLYTLAGQKAANGLWFENEEIEFRDSRASRAFLAKKGADPYLPIPRENFLAEECIQVQR